MNTLADDEEADERYESEMDSQSIPMLQLNVPEHETDICLYSIMSLIVYHVALVVC
ncbi:hypothetical protein DPMN_008278 [Dreissena polymorpha]|nr:hypothetical protein DPMN_008278 [Dreissena polymorpha]